MKSVFFILITLGLNYSVFTQNNIIKTVYYEGGDSETKIQLRVDFLQSNDLKFKLRHEDKTYSSIYGTSKLSVQNVTGFDEGYLPFKEIPITGNGTLNYLSGSNNGYVAVKRNNNGESVNIVFYKWDEFVEKHNLVASYVLRKPVDGGKILNWLLKD